jgi:hypothetical protein
MLKSKFSEGDGMAGMAGMKRLIICLMIVVPIVNSLANDTRETIDTIITYAIGVSGGTSLAMCSRVNPAEPIPFSFFVTTHPLIIKFQM